MADRKPAREYVARVMIPPYSREAMVRDIDIGDMFGADHAQQVTVASCLDEADLGLVNAAETGGLDYQYAPNLQVKRGPMIGPGGYVARVASRDAVVRVLKQRPMETGDMMLDIGGMPRYAQKSTVAAFIDSELESAQAEHNAGFEEVD